MNPQPDHYLDAASRLGRQSSVLAPTGFTRECLPVPAARPLVDRVRNRISKTVPPGSVITIVSKGDSALLILKQLTAPDFPSDADGAYVGFHPADNGEATRHLEQVGRRGVRFLVFPRTAFWSLNHHQPTGNATQAEARVGSFRPRVPHHGAPSTQDTTAYLSCDDRNLDVVFVCKEDPDKVRARHRLCGRRQEAKGVWMLVGKALGTRRPEEGG